MTKLKKSNLKNGLNAKECDDDLILLKEESENGPKKIMPKEKKAIKEYLRFLKKHQ